MKLEKLKKILIILAVIMGIVATAFSTIAFEKTISLNSPTTFPVDI